MSDSKDSLNMDFLRPNDDRNKRFQVNRVKSLSQNINYGRKDSIGGNSDFSQNEEENLHSITEKTRLSSSLYARSFRYVLYNFLGFIKIGF